MTGPLRPGQDPVGRPGARGPAALPTPPKGWPIGSYPTYAEAQRAVDHLSDQQFPVQQVTIVGVDLMQVERVTGRLSWPKVLGGGVLSGAWLGLFIGLILGFFSPSPWGALATGLIAGFGFYCLSQSYRIAPASVVAPFEFISMPLAVLWGIAVWDEVPPMTTFIGIVIIIGSGIYVLHREAVRKRHLSTGRGVRLRL